MTKNAVTLLRSANMDHALICACIHLHIVIYIHSMKFIHKFSYIYTSRIFALMFQFAQRRRSVVRSHLVSAVDVGTVLVRVLFL